MSTNTWSEATCEEKGATARWTTVWCPGEVPATPEPTREPSREPTKAPTPRPTFKPTAEPTREPTKEPTKEPTAAPPTPTCTATVYLNAFAVPSGSGTVLVRGSFEGGASGVEMVDNGWSFYYVALEVEAGSTHDYVFAIGRGDPGAADPVSRPPLGSVCDFNPDDEGAAYGFTAPACGQRLDLPAYRWGGGCGTTHTPEGYTGA